MKILIVGHGGREHALLRTLHRDAPDADFSITGSSGGIAELATSITIPVADSGGIADWAKQNAIDLVVVGPEVPLADGMVDRLMERGVAAFGPVAAAARIEASKAYAKALMQRAGVPTARHMTFDDADLAEQYVRREGAPIVVKASGLAAGKGAVVCDTVDDAIANVRSMLRTFDYGRAGAQVVIEEYMVGEEISFFALTDGTHALLMPGVQDHKRIGEGDTGPNTGGMGAYAPVSIDTPALRATVLNDIIAPTLAALRADRSTFRGLLYAGLMLTADGPKVVEFNCRFGDPETQALLPLLRSSLLDPMREIARGGSIRGHRLEWGDAAALTTVLASRGYPASSEKGREITIPEQVGKDQRIMVFHAGTRMEGTRLLTDGGRVLAVTAVATSLAEAARVSRAAADAITFDGKQYRRDIGWRELARQGVALAGPA
jgi:phosphoribosylamine--glycine ligase